MAWEKREERRKNTGDGDGNQHILALQKVDSKTAREDQKEKKQEVQS